MPMRLLLLSVVVSLTHGGAAFGQDVFGEWRIFPGPNPEAVDLLGRSDPTSDEAFRIGQLIFDFPLEPDFKVAEPVTELSNLPPVAEIVKAAQPGLALEALAQEQLRVPHQFDFEQATVVNYGSELGFLWNVTYELFPRQGGFSGVPYRYRAMTDGRGKIIPPRLTVFDAVFHSPDNGWTCSTLRLPTAPLKPDATPTEDELRERATAHLEAFYARLPPKLQASLSKRMQYRDQKLVRLPYSTDAKGKMIYNDLRAVNFVDPARKNRPEELFTVWAAPDGRLAELRHLDFHLNDDANRKGSGEPEPKDP